MSALEMSHVDLEQENHNLNHNHNHNHNHHHHHHHRSVIGSDVSVCFSDADDGTSNYSHFYSTNGGSYDDDYTFDCVSDPELGNGIEGVTNSRRVSSVSDCSVEMETVTGVSEIKVHLAKVERDCRICHMGLESESHESGIPIELGCSCKNDLAAAHLHCAEAWFKIKGNRTCEICHSIARNVNSGNEESTEHVIDINNATALSTLSTASPSAEPQRFWHGHRFLNFLLACMVFAFVISWLFHFNVPSS